MGDGKTDDDFSREMVPYEAMKACPGRCSRRIREGIVCCDPCWERIPTNVPGAARWRTQRKIARQINSWNSFEKATEAALAWLNAHPARKAK